MQALNGFLFIVHPYKEDKCVTQVFIEVEDVNDNAPVAGQPSYTASVPENCAARTEVLRVSAADLDGHTLTFDIISGNTAGHFSIDNTGITTTITTTTIIYTYIAINVYEFCRFHIRCFTLWWGYRLNKNIVYFIEK